MIVFAAGITIYKQCTILKASISASVLTNCTPFVHFMPTHKQQSKLYVADMEADSQPTFEPQKQRQKLEFLIVSDTHGTFQQMCPILNMKGDVFIHAGDFTDYGKEKDFLAFFEYLDKIRNAGGFKHTIVIAGNHQISLDRTCVTKKKREIYLKRNPCSLSREQIVHQLGKRAIYLEHQAIQINGVNIFGSPFTPYCVGNAFQYRHWDEEMIWGAVPSNIDLLVTHGPPKGILDLNSEKVPCGSLKLRQKVFTIRPKYHVFGHIHEAAGMMKMEGITFVNVAMTPTRIIV